MPTALPQQRREMELDQQKRQKENLQKILCLQRIQSQKGLPAVLLEQKRGSFK